MTVTSIVLFSKQNIRFSVHFIRSSFLKRYGIDSRENVFFSFGCHEHSPCLFYIEQTSIFTKTFPETRVSRCETRRGTRALNRNGVHLLGQPSCFSGRINQRSRKREVARTCVAYTALTGWSCFRTLVLHGTPDFNISPTLATTCGFESRINTYALRFWKNILANIDHIARLNSGAENNVQTKN